MFIYVITGNAREYQDFVKGLESDEENTYIYVEKAETLRGAAKGIVHRIGTWTSRWNILDIEETIKREKLDISKYPDHGSY